MPITYTNYFDTNVVEPLVTLLRNEFPSVAILKGDTKKGIIQPTIIIEPLTKKIETESTNALKRMNFNVLFICALMDAYVENAVIQITDLVEHLEQLLLNNKRYPSGSGTNWNNSWLDQGVEFGFRQKQGLFMRVATIRWSCDSWQTR